MASWINKLFRATDLRPPASTDRIAELIAEAETAASSGKRERAIELYGRAIDSAPSHAVAHYKRANFFKDLGRLDDALSDYDRAISLDPQYANAYCNRGVVLAAMDRLETAIASYDHALAHNSRDAIAWYNRGAALRELGKLPEALASIDHALDINPNYAEAHCNRGILLAELKRWDEALGGYDRAIEIHPGLPQAHFNRGTLLHKNKQWSAALASYDEAIRCDPAYAEAHCNRGALLTDLNQWSAARASIDRAIELQPDFAEAHYQRGLLYAVTRRLEGAIANLDRAIALKPDYAAAFHRRAEILMQMSQFGGAIASYDEALLLEPGRDFLRSDLRHARMCVCDWRDLDEDVQQLSAGLEADQAAWAPFHITALLGSPHLTHKAAEIWSRLAFPPNEQLGPIIPGIRGEKIKVGYFSADLHTHPVALLAAELFETHDRSMFEITAFSLIAVENDPMRTRLEKAFDRFIDVSQRSDIEVASMARELGIDIAVDLGGYTLQSRTGIFALRAAPAQVSFIGYPGSMGADYIDYLIADSTVIPPSCFDHFSEKIVHLPGSYLPNDSTREVAETGFSRVQLGLPAAGFVFCCFNNSYKITPDVFDGWMRILGRIPKSVLWLSRNNEWAIQNLRREADKRGVDPARLVFADRIPSAADHLARLRAADLFLDTRPYNAHATAIDALWAGVPVLTCPGESFAARVAASLLTAIELPELIASSPAAYEERAVHFGTHPEELATLRKKLSANRHTTALFDTETYTRHLESAYRQIYERHQAGLPPDHVQVARIPPASRT